MDRVTKPWQKPTLHGLLTAGFMQQLISDQDGEWMGPDQVPRRSRTTPKVPYHITVRATDGHTRAHSSSPRIIARQWQQADRQASGF